MDYYQIPNEEILILCQMGWFITICRMGWFIKSCVFFKNIGSCVCFIICFDDKYFKVKINVLARFLDDGCIFLFDVLILLLIFFHRCWRPTLTTNILGTKEEIICGWCFCLKCECEGNTIEFLTEL